MYRRCFGDVSKCIRPIERLRLSSATVASCGIPISYSRSRAARHEQAVLRHALDNGAIACLSRMTARTSAPTPQAAINAINAGVPI